MTVRKSNNVEKKKTGELAVDRSSHEPSIEVDSSDKVR